MKKFIASGLVITLFLLSACVNRAPGAQEYSNVSVGGLTKVQYPDGYTFRKLPRSVQIMRGQTYRLGQQDLDGVRVIRVGDTVRIILLTDQFFPVNHLQLRRDPDYRLDMVASLLNGEYANVPVHVSAYSDDLNAYHNADAVTLMQAEAIIAYLWQRGVDQRRLKPIGYGRMEQYTIASNRHPTGSALNRRVELTLKLYDDGLKLRIDK